MSKNPIKFVLTGAISAFLCSCASSGNHDVNVAMQASAPYAPIPVSSVHVSSHPPMGKYIVLAALSADAQPNESPTHLLARLQQSAAAIGADYVLVTSVTDKTVMTPEIVDAPGEVNPVIAADRNWNSTANSTSTGTPTNVFEREVITGNALKITSGTNKPNKQAPSMLWQVNQ